MKRERTSGPRLFRLAVALSVMFTAAVGFGNGETQAARGPATLSFVHGGTELIVNGEKKIRTPFPVVKGVTMIPASTLAATLGAKLYTDKNGIHIDTYFNKITVNNDMRGSKHNNEYVLLPAPVLKLNGSTYLPLSAIPLLWPGATYTFSPAERKIDIVFLPEPNVKPVADFTAPTVVKRGEPFDILDKSYDPDGKIVKSEWTTNGKIEKSDFARKKKVFFEAGTYTVTHSVYDNDGEQSNIATKEIRVTDEVMYTPFEYYMRYGEPGDKVKIDNALMKEYPGLNSSETRGGRTLYLSNAPERVFESGVLYQDVLSGPSRIFLHHRNGSQERLKLAIIVTNQQSSDINLTVGNKGLAGPSPSALQFGYAAVQRYFTGSAKKNMTVPANGSIVLLPELEKIVMNEGDGISGLIDVDTDGPLLFTTVMVREFDDPLSNVFALPILERVGNRGTFQNTDRSIEVNQIIDTEMQFRLGDRGDTIPGFDALSGRNTVDGGEYGAVTTIKLKNLSYGMRIVLNPRAGNFAGAVIVNGKVISVPNGGFAGPSDAVLLYTQNLPEGASEDDPPPEVSITFSSPGASSLPVLLVFFPERLL